MYSATGQKSPSPPPKNINVFKSEKQIFRIFSAGFSSLFFLEFFRIPPTQFLRQRVMKNNGGKMEPCIRKFRPSGKNIFTHGLFFFERGHLD